MSLHQSRSYLERTYKTLCKICARLGSNEGEVQGFGQFYSLVLQFLTSHCLWLPNQVYETTAIAYGTQTWDPHRGRQSAIWGGQHRSPGSVSIQVFCLPFACVRSSSASNGEFRKRRSGQLSFFHLKLCRAPHLTHNPLPKVKLCTRTHLAQQLWHPPATLSLRSFLKLVT